jgi:hypothetical protein
LKEGCVYYFSDGGAAALVSSQSEVSLDLHHMQIANRKAESTCQWSVPMPICSCSCSCC